MARLLRSLAFTAGAAAKFPASYYRRCSSEIFNKFNEIRFVPSRASNGDSCKLRLNRGLGCSFNVQRTFTSGVDYSSPSANVAPAENRSERAKKALGFTKSGYTFVVGRKSVFCNGHHSFLWSERCFHLTWLAVHGSESICLVTWSQDLDLSSLLPAFRDNCTAERTMCSFGETIISEVECLLHFDADYNDDDLRKLSGRGKKTPFAVVSVVADKNKVPKGSFLEDYDIDKAFEFWEGKMKSGLASSVDETILTAISGFRHLCPKKLNAEDIWVTVLTPSNGEIMHLHLNKRREYLAVMKDGGSSSGLGVSSELAPAIVSATPPVWVYKTNLREPSLMKEFGLDDA